VRATRRRENRWRRLLWRYRTASKVRRRHRQLARSQRARWQARRDTAEVVCLPRAPLSAQNARPDDRTRPRRTVPREPPRRSAQRPQGAGGARTSLVQRIAGLSRNRLGRWVPKWCQVAELLTHSSALTVPAKRLYSHRYATGKLWMSAKLPCSVASLPAGARSLLAPGSRRRRGSRQRAVSGGRRGVEGARPRPDVVAAQYDGARVLAAPGAPHPTQSYADSSWPPFAGARAHGAGLGSARRSAGAGGAQDDRSGVGRYGRADARAMCRAMRVRTPEIGQ
jgi:hypothetical protein